MLLGILYLVSSASFAGLPTEAFTGTARVLDYDGTNDSVTFSSSMFGGSSYTYSDGSASPPIPTSTAFIDLSVYIDPVTSSAAYACGTELASPNRFECWGSLSQQHMPSGLVSATWYTVGSTTEEGVLNYNGDVVLWYSGTSPSSPYTTTSDIPGTGYTGLVVTRDFAMATKPGSGLYYTGTNRNGLLSTVATRHRDGETTWALVASRYWYGGYNEDGDDFFVECPTSGTTYYASCTALKNNAPMDGVDYDSAAGIVPKVADASLEGEFLAVVWYTDYTATVWTAWDGSGIYADQIENLPGYAMYGVDPDTFTPVDDDGNPIEWSGPLHIGHHSLTPSIVGVLNDDYVIDGDYLVKGTTIVTTNVGMTSYAP